jgi:hypothetical protein
MKIDPGMHIGLHLVFFGKTGVTILGQKSHIFLLIRHCPGVTNGHTTPYSCSSIARVHVTIRQPSC